MQESSKQLLQDKIRDLGLEDHFRIMNTEIIGPNESLMVFKGLQGNSVFSLKSMEGFDRVWVEEAQSSSQASLDVMSPTFRTDGTELYFTWNPIDEDDPVEKLFNSNAGDQDFICVTTTYADNPWFPTALRRDMERDRVREPDKYAHVWLGGYQRLTQARVFHNWRIVPFETPEDSRFFFGADWGFSVDPSVIVRCWIRGKSLMVDYEAYKVGCEIVDTPDLFDKVPESRKWPIRADSARPETISYMQANGFPKITGAVKGKNSVEDGVEFLKSYDIVVHPRCVHTSDELSKYSYKIDKRTGDVLPVLDDSSNHVIDSLRYALEGERLAPKKLNISRELIGRVQGHGRAMRVLHG
jgi:phage terminase large subunit